MEINTVLITQAREGSTRLPGKILKKIQGKELLLIHLERVKKATLVNKIIIATTVEPQDNVIEDLVKNWGYDCFRGSENDVLDRYYQAIVQSGSCPQWIIRVTSDCPLIDPALIDEIVAFAQKSDADYVSNALDEHYPDGQDIEVFKFSALADAWKMAVLPSEREHVTPFIRNRLNGDGYNYFKIKSFPYKENFSNIRMTVDEESDFFLVDNLVNNLGTEKGWLEYTNYIIDNNLSMLNSNIIRNEGYLKSLKNELK